MTSERKEDARDARKRCAARAAGSVSDVASRTANRHARRLSNRNLAMVQGPNENATRECADD